ncbi:MAG TPA: hypothetical protein VE842_02310 [Pyrinomonadaceae bacterium]|jgi:hypothetical protein|nr:hypothetical protein [Pyrinomonadaceae bacterium]
MKNFRYFALVIALLAFLVGAPLLTTPSSADNGPNHRVRNLHFGVSGGNVKDISRRYCCSGTLGSLVKDTSNVNYILSNNHVLAIGDKALAGDDISQPGLIDNNCQIPPIVADFTVAPKLGSNVDAAIAQLRTGQMDATGFIEDIGVPSSIVRNPAVGLGVAKSGRTTGFQTGSISSINTSVTVKYTIECGSSRGTNVSYTNQVVINSTTFSAGGDSGSLIVTNDSCHQPVALLFAGSSTATIGNPIGEVLSKTGAALGRTLSFVGTTCGTAGAAAAGGSTSSTGGQMRELPEQAAERATQVLEARRNDLMSRPSVIGVGVGQSETDSSQAVIVIYVDRTAGVKPSLPRTIEGIRVKRVETDPFVAN